MKLPRFPKVKSRRGSGKEIDVIVPMTTKEKTIARFLTHNFSRLGLNVLGSTFRALTKMITRLCLGCCSRFFILKYRRFCIFAVLLGVLSLVSYALVFRRMALTMSHNYLAKNQTGAAITNAKDRENLSHIKKITTNYSNAACKLPDLDPFHSSVIHFMKDLGKLRCNGVSYSSFENNVLRIEGEGVGSAQYRKIERTPRNDFGVLLSDPVNVQSTSGSGVAAKIPKGKQNM